MRYPAALQPRRDCDEEEQVFGGTDCDGLAARDAWATVPEVTRKLRISEATYYVWRKRYGQMAAAEILRLRQLEEENHKLKQLVPDLPLDKVILQ